MNYRKSLINDIRADLDRLEELDKPSDDEVKDNYSFEVNGKIEADLVQCLQCSKVINVMTEYYKLEEHYLDHKNHPNVKLWFSDNGKNGILFNVETYDRDLPCDKCDIKGSYYIVNEKYKVGACEEHLYNNENIGENKLYKKCEIVYSDSLDGIFPDTRHGFLIKRVTSKVEQVWVLAENEEDAEEIGYHQNDLKWKEKIIQNGETISIVDEDIVLTKENFSQ